MNEHTWEKLDADMRSEMSEQYIQERCPHEDVYIDNIVVKIQSEPIASLEQWKKYLWKNGTTQFELYAEVVCEKCGASQEQYIEISDIEFIPEKLLEWEE